MRTFLALSASFWGHVFAATVAALGFVPLPSADDGSATHIATHETTVGEFRAFVAATGHDAFGKMYTLGADDYDWAPRGHTWDDPEFPQTENDPVVGVSLEDARAYASWLTQRHHAEGSLAKTMTYRLPTDREWSVAVGLTEERGETPEERMAWAESGYPWGADWPPPENFGNFAGTESAAGKPSWWGTIPGGYTDSFPRTAPVGTFPPNALGCFDLSGNVWEWVDERYTTSSIAHVIRGGCWGSDRPAYVLLAKRNPTYAATRNDELGFRLVIAPSTDSPEIKAGPPTELTPITVIFDWIANVQFAGLLVAQERGWYREAGLNVTLKPADPVAPDNIARVRTAEGLVVGIADGSALLKARAKGAPMQVFGTIFQASPIGVMTLTSSPFESLADLRGQKIGIHAYNRDQLGMMLRSVGLGLDEVTPIVLHDDHHSLPEGEVAAQVAYVIDEKVAFETAGHPVRVFAGRDHGYLAYSQVYYTIEANRAIHSEALRAFLAASNRGWRAAIADPTATAQLVVSRYQPQLQVAYQADSLRLIADLLFVESGPENMGKMTRETWLQTPGATPELVDALFAPIDKN